jgi:hypothetical protein
MPFDSENAFVPADPSEWARIRALPHIVVYPKPPPNAPSSDGIDDWIVPGKAADGPDDWIVPGNPRTDVSYPNDWSVPPPSAMPNTGQLAFRAPRNVASPSVSNPPAPRPDPFAAYWSLIPASRVGAMAWDPPIFPGDSPAWPARSLPAGIPNVPTSGGLLGALAQLGSSSLGPGSSIPSGGLPGALAQLGSSSPGPGSSFPSPPQPQSANAQAVSPIGRRPIADYSAGEILGDAAKSFGVGMGRFGVQSAGLLGDAREMLANGAQRAADYLVPGAAPNAGSKVSDFLASYPLLAGPTSSQLRSAVESYTGPFYQPKTIVGDYAQTAGEFVPGALLMPGGSLATNAIRYGLLPALSSETAGQLTQGTAAEPWARTAGAILGAAPGAWRGLPWARSAPEVAETLAESRPSPAEQLAARRRAQLEVNKAAGAEFENQTATSLEQRGANLAPQITLETRSGLQTRMDFLSRGPGAEKIRCIECKASATAPVTAIQKKAFKEIAEGGATIVGAGKPGYEGGMRIPATQVEILRP